MLKVATGLASITVLSHSPSIRGHSREKSSALASNQRQRAISGSLVTIKVKAMSCPAKYQAPVERNETKGRERGSGVEYEIDITNGYK